MSGKGSKRRPENRKAVEDRWPLEERARVYHDDDERGPYTILNNPYLPPEYLRALKRLPDRKGRR